MFGSTGAGGILVKVTAGLATVFLITSLTYNVLTGNRVTQQDSLMLQGDNIVQPIVPADQQKPAVKFKDSGEDAKSE
jgi:preprotein translocase subunit SecG